MVTFGKLLVQNSLCVVVVLSCTILVACCKRLRMSILKNREELQTPIKIVMGLMQVLALLKAVLNLVFPPAPHHAMSYAALLTVDVRDIFHFDCSGWTWYDKWILLTLGVPAFGFICVGLLWCQQSRSVANARQIAIGRLFFIVMLLYPQISQSIFSMLRCRQLSGILSVLEVDYSIQCTDARYLWFRLLAQILVVLWPVGIPCGLAWLLWREHKNSRAQWLELETTTLDTVDTVTNPTHNQSPRIGSDRGDSLATFHSQRIRPNYGFCTAAYRDKCFWFEPVDMIRKLALTGLLQLVNRGSAQQVLIGCGLAFLCFGLQLVVQPYREVEDNVLKALVEVQIFLTFQISFILRVFPQIASFETTGAVTYGYILVGSLVAFLVTAVVLVANRLIRSRKQFASEAVWLELSSVNIPGLVTSPASVNTVELERQDLTRTGAGE
jgi:hypothetical protein